MGMLDGLLGGGKDEDEEEMQENIDKIREKVREGQAPPEPAEGPGEDRGGEAPVRLDELKEDEGGAPPREGPPARESQNRREPPAEPGPAPSRERGQQGGGSGPEPRGPTRDDLPEPPEVKELDVPDIEKGPLFITVDKFRDALRTISDLRMMASDIDDYIGSMEDTLQEDRETEEGFRRVLEDGEADTERLKDIVSP